MSHGAGELPEKKLQTGLEALQNRSAGSALPALTREQERSLTPRISKMPSPRRVRWSSTNGNYLILRQPNGSGKITCA